MYGWEKSKGQTWERVLTMKKVALVMIIVISMIAGASLCVFNQPVIASAPQPYLIVPDNYSTISEAILNVANGGTIAVRSGTYQESLWIDHPLSIIGFDRQNTILDSPYGGNLVNIESNDVTLSHLTFHFTQDSFST
jgi:hypothetical protein